MWDNKRLIALHVDHDFEFTIQNLTHLLVRLVTTEEPQDIINDMLAGLDAEDMRKTLSIADRKEAIRTACMLAEKGDVILVAGKGHENYQEIKGVKHHFDDKEILKEIFK